jgi:hypothetical protein
LQEKEERFESVMVVKVASRDLKSTEKELNAEKDF